MGKEILIFGDTEIEKHKFYGYKRFFQKMQILRSGKVKHELRVASYEFRYTS